LIEVRVERAVEGIGRATEEVLDEVEGLLGRVAGAVAARARDYAPVRTGRLRESIESRRAGRLKYVVRASAPYAGYVEFGTSRTPPRRYMQRALAEALTAFSAATRP
jgi:HK97 gp10 family phage protein